MAVDEAVRLADVEVPHVVPHLTEAESKARGKQCRDKAPRASHAVFEAGTDRPDPVALLESQAPSRVPELVPIRYGRMLVSPFTFYRGAALIMASDLSTTTRSGLNAQICGDAHLSNFGVFGSPERQLVFDCNDFDETLPGPWEWDVKRLAASIVVASRGLGFSKTARAEAILGLGRVYRENMRTMAAQSNLDVWYSHVDIQGVVDTLQQHAAATKSKAEQHMAAVATKTTTRALSKDSMRALDKLTKVVDGRRVIVSDPPLIVPVQELLPDIQSEQMVSTFHTVLRKYRQSLPTDRRHLLEQYTFSQLARKVVGVGSVGTRCWIVLLHGQRPDDILFLQAKEAEASVLERFTKKSQYANHGARVVAGQRLMQASSDILLGWQRNDGLDGVARDYYIRQLQDWKGSIDTDDAIPQGMRVYGELCAHTLARAHARSGDRIAIAAYLGASNTFEKALTRFAETYADQNERDYEAFKAACKSGRLHAETGI
ncbi:MAG TPA: DUF2252 domain-containing protein [Acidimicrobiales bacterium]|nr:DUF2252 domain-containing protein [Acidimicrobiales bacterium]